MVSDGDSIRIGKLRIRIHGIDAPELRQQCEDARGRAYACGQKSTHALTALIGSQGAVVEPPLPVRMSDPSSPDYGRPVCWTGPRLPGR